MRLQVQSSLTMFLKSLYCDSSSWFGCQGRLYEVISIVRLDRTHFSLGPSGAEVTGIGQLQDTWLSHLICCGPWRSSRGQTSLKLHSPELNDIECWYSWRHCYELDSLTKRQHPKCHCRELEPNWDRLIETCKPANRTIEPLLPHRMLLRIRP